MLVLLLLVSLLVVAVVRCCLSVVVVVVVVICDGRSSQPTNTISIANFVSSLCCRSINDNTTATIATTTIVTTTTGQCMCECRDEVLQLDQKQIYKLAGGETIFDVFSNGSRTWMESHFGGDLFGPDHVLDLALREFCHVGWPGEMYTSAAPWDPIFWPLHGLAERFLR